MTRVHKAGHKYKKILDRLAAKLSEYDPLASSQSLYPVRPSYEGDFLRKSGETYLLGANFIIYYPRKPTR